MLRRFYVWFSAADLYSPAGGEGVDHLRVHSFPVIQIPLIQPAEQNFGGGNVGGNGNTVHITQPQQILFGHIGGICVQRVPEKQHKIHLVASHPGCDLLQTTQSPGEVALHRQGYIMAETLKKEI